MQIQADSVSVLGLLWDVIPGFRVPLPRSLWVQVGRKVPVNQGVRCYPERHTNRHRHTNTQTLRLDMYVLIAVLSITDWFKHHVKA